MSALSKKLFDCGIGAQRKYKRDDWQPNEPNKFEKQEILTAWQKKLEDRGWLAPNWPKEYGGTGWSVTQRYIFDEECGAASAPSALPFGVTMVAPVIIKFGTEEQKKLYLPKILSSEHWWWLYLLMLLKVKGTHLVFRMPNFHSEGLRELLTFYG